MLVKIHNAYRIAVAVCDDDLLGKKFSEGERQLDLTGGFFKGEQKTRDEVMEIMRDALREDAIFNIVGEESCRAAEECGLIKGDAVMRIAGIPVVLALL